MFYIIQIIVYALLIGSFLNVCIHRIPLQATVVTTPSHCILCKAPIKTYDLIPVISYIFLGGKCRNCGCKISIRYLLVELTNTLIYLWIYSVYGMSVQFVGLAFLASCLIVMVVIDYEHQIIPDGLVLIILFTGIIYNILNPQLQFLDSFIGFFAVSIPLLILLILSKGGMGMGDIKLMAACGVFIGWKFILLALIVGAVIGSIVGVLLILTKKIKRREPIPFGPFLGIGIFLSALYGDQIIKWYLSMFLI